MATRPSLDDLLRDVPPERLEQPCRDEHISEIALSITGWQSIAPFLHLSKGEEEEITCEYPNKLLPQKIAMLRKWKEKYGASATYRRLVDVFWQVGRTNLVEDVTTVLLSEVELSEEGEWFDAQEEIDEVEWLDALDDLSVSAGTRDDLTAHPGGGSRSHTSEPTACVSTTSDAHSQRKPTLEELLQTQDVPPESLDKKCSDEHLSEIACSVTRWKSIAPWLGLVLPEVEAIERECKETQTWKIVMLQKWKAKMGKKAKYKRLVKVFWDAERTDLVVKTCEVLQDMSSDSSSDSDAHKAKPCIAVVNENDPWPKSPLNDVAKDKEPTGATPVSSGGVSRPSLEQLTKDVPPESLNKQCRDDHLSEIACSVTEWESIAPWLGLVPPEIEEIERDCKKTQTRKIVMLQKWKAKMGKKAKYKRLVKAFWDAERTDLVVKTCEVLQDMSSDSSSGSNEETVVYDETVVTSYADYLRMRYGTEIPTFRRVQWPPPPTRKVFNLAMVRRATMEYGPSNEELVRLLLKGKVRDAMRDSKRTPVELKDIFKLSEKEKKVVVIDGKRQVIEIEKERKVVLIEGAPGSGKSTLAWHVCQKWKSGELFQEFKTVVFIQLRDPAIQSAKSLSKLLPSGSRKEAKMMASQLRACKGRDTLFVVDSWDELPVELHTDSIFERLISDPQTLSLDLSTLVITSRPIASAELHEYVSARIEIMGFTETEVELYFSEALREDHQAVQRLQDQLRERPVIEASCYLPLNAAIVVHLFLTLSRTLPTTLHGVFSSLVLCCLVRHVRKQSEKPKQIPKIPSLTDLPPDLQEPFKNICTLAYHGVKETKATFSAADLETFNLPTELSTLSLIQGVESFTCLDRSVSYNFLHLSIQELLAAFHISKMSPSEQVKDFKKLFGQPRFAAVFRFYAAFSKLRTKGIREVVVDIVKGRDKHQLLSLLHCLYEAQDISLCEFVASQLNGGLDLSLTTISPLDTITVGYFLSCVCLTTRGEFTVDLSFCSLDDYRVGLLVRELSKCCSSSSGQKKTATDAGGTGCLDLDLSGNHIHGNGTKHIAGLISSSSVISKLGLSYKIQEGEDGLYHLCRALTTNSSLVELGLFDCSLTITEENGPVLSHMLQTNKTLKVLMLQHNTGVSDVGAHYIAKGLEHNSGLQELYLEECGITTRGVEYLAKALTVNKSLETFEITENAICDDGGAHIADALKVNTSLKDLRMDSCKITEKGVQSLAEALKVNRTLEWLSLSKNPISDCGAVIIAEGLKHNHSLKSLWISDCAVTNQGIHSLAGALEVNTSLQELDLSKNQLTDQGMHSLAGALEVNTSLEELNLSKNQFTDQGMHSLAGALEVNTSLEKLDLSYNQFTNTGLVALGDSLKSNRGLQTLILSKLEKVTDKGLKQFVLSLKENYHLTTLHVSETAGGAKTVKHETEIVNQTRRQRGVGVLTVKDF